MHFLPPDGCRSVFPAKSCQDVWSSNQLARGQVNMPDEAKLSSPIHSIFFFQKDYPLFSFQYSSVQFSSFNFWSVGCSMCSQALSWKRIRPFLLTNDSCRHCRVWCTSSVFWAYFSDIMVLLGFGKLFWIRWLADHQRVTMTLLVEVWLWEGLCSFFLV